MSTGGDRAIEKRGMEHMGSDTTVFDVVRDIEGEFAHNPDAQIFNLLLLQGLAVRLSTARFQKIRAEAPRIFGVKADLLSLHLSIEVAAAGANQKLSPHPAELPCAGLYNLLNKYSAVPEEQFQEDLTNVANLKEQVLLEGAGVEREEDILNSLAQTRSEVRAWDVFMRHTSDKLFRKQVRPYCRNGERLPDEMVNRQLLFYYSDPEYWKSVIVPGMPSERNLLRWVTKEHLHVAQQLEFSPLVERPEEFLFELAGNDIEDQQWRRLLGTAPVHGFTEQ